LTKRKKIERQERRGQEKMRGETAEEDRGAKGDPMRDLALKITLLLLSLPPPSSFLSPILPHTLQETTIFIKLQNI
jgi:hypothetical protein